ncbi:MAG: hypothetical protein RLZ51_894 [Pseudomonadota bacterium]|jgi:hypothetical protein
MSHTKVITTPLPLPSADERRRLTIEALDDVDAGRLIDHQSVKEWADRLDTPGEETAPIVR